MILPKLFFGWSNLKKLLIEVFYTLSADKSKLSAKRLTMFVANSSVICLTWVFILAMLWLGKLTATDFVISISPMVGIGAYNLSKAESAKDKLKELKELKEDSKVD